MARCKPRDHAAAPADYQCTGAVIKHRKGMGGRPTGYKTDGCRCCDCRWWNAQQKRRERGHPEPAPGGPEPPPTRPDGAPAARRPRYPRRRPARAPGSVGQVAPEPAPTAPEPSPPAASPEPPPPAVPGPRGPRIGAVAAPYSPQPWEAGYAAPEPAPEPAEPEPAGPSMQARIAANLGLPILAPARPITPFTIANEIRAGFGRKPTRITELLATNPQPAAPVMPESPVESMNEYPAEPPLLGGLG